MCFSLAMIEHERLYVNVEKHKSLSFVWSWSSLVEGDEQLDWPNSQTTVELCHASVAYFFGLTETQQLFAWADPAFISYY